MIGTPTITFAISSAAVLSGALVAISRALRSASASRRLVVASFAGGVSLAFVTLDLLVELVSGVQLTAPLAFEPVAVLLLAGIVIAFVTDTYVTRRASGGYAAALLPRIVYCALIGAMLVEEAHENMRGFPLFWLAMALHLGVTDHWLTRAFGDAHGSRSRWAFAIALLSGAIVWSVAQPAHVVFHALLAVVGGATLLAVFREEIPNAVDARLRAFVSGVVLFGALATLRWRF
jgi:hypothetical protein